MARQKTIGAVDPGFSDAYEEELRYMRELLLEFTLDHPKIARRLGIQAGEIGDPYVERLIQAFAWEAARSQLRIDAAFPEFTQRLLEAVYPNYVRPTPSMSVARLFPDPQRDIPLDGFMLKRGSMLASAIPRDERTSCLFTTSQNVTLYPLEIVKAKLTGIPPDILSLQGKIPEHSQVKGALRMTFRTTGECRINELVNLERLPIYLATGNEALASRLFELIHTAALATVIGEPERFDEPCAPVSIVYPDAVQHHAMEPGDGTLPQDLPKFHGNNLLHEYFSNPSQFYFFTLTGLKNGFAAISENEAEIVILLGRDPGELAHEVDASQFALFCTPVTNLFLKKLTAIEVAFTDDEVLLVLDALREADYEVFSVARLYASSTETSGKLEFLPCDIALRQDEGNHDRYFRLRRETIAFIAGEKRRYGTHMPYTPSRLHVSLVDAQNHPYPGMNYVETWLWLTNADLPGLIERNGKTDLELLVSAPVCSVGLIRPLSAPWPPLAQGDDAWKLISLLNIHASPFIAMNDGKAVADILRERLRIFVRPWDEMGRRMVYSIVDFSIEPVTCLLPEKSLRFGRGLGIRLTMDESMLEGVSPYLFGLVLERWVTQLASQNSATRLELHSLQRGKIADWPAREGTRSII